MLKLRNQRSRGQCRGEGQTRPSGEIQQVSGRRQLSRNILAQFSLVHSQANILPTVVLGVASILPVVCSCSLCPCALVVSGYGDVKLLKLKLGDSTG